MANTALATPPPAVDYPASDGQPMAETDHQRTPLTYAVDRLRLHFRDRPDVYVSGNLFIYYEEGNPQAVVAPDVFMVMGADGRPTNDYLTPPLQGLELIAGKYERLPAWERSGGELALTSAVLGLELRLSHRGLRFHDPRAGRDLSNLAETDDERQRAERERSRDRQRAEQERQRAEQERQRAEQAESRLAREAAARRAQARVAELEALLKRAESG